MLETRAESLISKLLLSIIYTFQSTICYRNNSLYLPVWMKGKTVDRSAKLDILDIEDGRR